MKVTEIPSGEKDSRTRRPSVMAVLIPYKILLTRLTGVPLALKYVSGSNSFWPKKPS